MVAKIIWNMVCSKIPCVDSRIHTSLKIREMREHMCISVGSICGAALSGSKTRKSNCLGPISFYKLLASSKLRVCAYQTQRSFTWSSIRVTNMECLRWRDECTILCDRAVFSPVMPSSDASFTTRRKSRSRFAPRMRREPIRIRSARSVESRKKAMIMNTLKIENIFS